MDKFVRPPAGKRGVTDKQLIVARYISDYSAAAGHSPTRLELCKGVAIGSNDILRFIEALEFNGCVAWPCKLDWKNITLTEKCKWLLKTRATQ